jgi:hypothetical protein
MAHGEGDVLRPRRDRSQMIRSSAGATSIGTRRTQCASDQIGYLSIEN